MILFKGPQDNQYKTKTEPYNNIDQEIREFNNIKRRIITLLITHSLETKEHGLSVLNHGIADKSACFCTCLGYENRLWFPGILLYRNS